MRTTINVDDQLLLLAKARAAASGMTLAKLIEDALRDLLRRCDLVKDRKPVKLITVKGTGTRPGIDLDDGRSLLDIMDR